MRVTRRSVLGLMAVGVMGVPPGVARAADPLLSDAKLAGNAKIEAEGVAVSDLLAVLSEKTGVVFTSRGIVADEKVVLFGPRRPVRETLSDLAALLNATWKPERTSTGGMRYVLELGTAAQRYEQKLARARLDALIAQVDAHVRALGEAPEQLAKRPSNDLTRRLLSDPQGRLSAEFFSLLSPAQREQLFTRRRLNVSFDALNRPQQDGLRRIWTMVLDAEMAYFASPEGMANGSMATIRRKTEDIERGFLRMRVQRIGGNALIGMFAGGFPIATEAVMSETGRPGFSTSGWPIYFVPGKDTWLLPPHGNPYTGEPVSRDPLPQALELGPQKNWISTLRALAEKTGKPVLSDFYRMPPVAAPPDIPANENTGAGVASLDHVCRSPGYLWWLRGGSLLCRKRDWFDQRPHEIPDRWLSNVARELGGEHRLTIAVIRQVLRLSPEQTAGLHSLREGSVTEEPEGLYPLRALLRVIEAGDPTGKRAFPSSPDTAVGSVPASAPTLTATRLTPLQQRLVPEFLAETDGMLGAQLPPAFRAWVTTARHVRSTGFDGLPMVDMEVRWSFDAGGRLPTLRLPLPTAKPQVKLRIEL